jgi:type II secretory pathway pseudopilin PulG
MNLLKQNKGFILLEKLLYISLVSIALVILTMFLVDVVRNSTTAINAKEVQQNNRLILSRITQEIKTAKQITSLEPTCISFIDSEDNPVNFYWDSGQEAIFYHSGLEDIRISNSDVRITQLDFNSFDEVIEIKLELENLKPGNHAVNPYHLQSSSLVVPREKLY